MVPQERVFETDYSCGPEFLHLLWYILCCVTSKEALVCTRDAHFQGVYDPANTFSSVSETKDAYDGA